jgi:hypothetical protein
VFRYAPIVVGRRVVAAIGTWKVSGMRGILRLARSKLYWHGRFIRFQVDLGSWPAGGTAGAAGIVAREGRREELIRFRCTARGLPREFYADQTHGASRFYLGFVDGRIGHISWVFSARDRPPQIQLQDDEVMVDCAYTCHEFRGLGLFGAAQRAVLDDAKRERIRRVFMHVSHDNIPSLRSVVRTGFRPVGVLDWWWVLGVALVSVDEQSSRIADLLLLTGL